MPDLPHWFDKRREKQNERSRKQEREHARSVGGVVQAGSGSSWRRPQDVQQHLRPDGDTFLDQLKFTDKDGFRITAAECKRIHSDALRDGRTGRLIIDFEQHGVRVVCAIEVGTGSVTR